MTVTDRPWRSRTWPSAPGIRSVLVSRSSWARTAPASVIGPGFAAAGADSPTTIAAAAMPTTTGRALGLNVIAQACWPTRDWLNGANPRTGGRAGPNPRWLRI